MSVLAIPPQHSWRLMGYGCLRIFLATEADIQTINKQGTELGLCNRKKKMSVSLIFLTALLLYHDVYELFRYLIHGDQLLWQLLYDSVRHIMSMLQLHNSRSQCIRLKQYTLTSSVLCVGPPVTQVNFCCSRNDQLQLPSIENRHQTWIYHLIKNIIGTTNFSLWTCDILGSHVGLFIQVCCMQL